MENPGGCGLLEAGVRKREAGEVGEAEGEEEEETVRDYSLEINSFPCPNSAEPSQNRSAHVQATDEEKGGLISKNIAAHKRRDRMLKGTKPSLKF
jgi:hypothetical protein